MKGGNRLYASATRRVAGGIMALNGHLDARQLRRLIPLFPSGKNISCATEDLRPAYNRYVATVSSVGMAASLQTSAVLLALCRSGRLTSAADFGSGFSSYVLRLWARESGCEVFSIDDDPAWLLRTEQFLATQYVSSSDLCLWPDVPQRTFELVFHDLSSGTQREAAMPVALNASSRFVVFDDAHHKGHRRAMASTCASVPAKLYSLRSTTLDRLHRYAMLAVR